jgi:hypothetical protein
MIKSMRMRLEGHVARMGRRKTRINYWWERQRENQDVGGYIVLRWIVERCDGVLWRALVNAVMNTMGP